jgi:hypothetical protein
VTPWSSKTNLDRWVLGGILAYLSAALVASLTCDVLVSWHPLMDRVGYPVWYILHREAGPTENLQWLSLGLSILCCGVLAGLGVARAALGRVRMNSAGWLVLGFGLVLLIMEDAGNVRHVMREQVVFVLNTPVEATALVVELIIYTVFSLVMLLGLALTWRQWICPGGAWKRILLGFAAYGVAGFASATRNVGDWYVVAGGRLITWLGMTDDVRWTTFAGIAGGLRETGFYLMDLMLEESLELLAVGLILSSLLHQIQRTAATLGVDRDPSG